MKNKAVKLATTTALGLGMVTAALFVTAKQRNKVSPVLADEPVHGTLTVDTNHFWGEGAESYKFAACFIDGTPEGEYWTSLVTVEAPNRLASVYFELPIDLEPTSVVLYKYSADVEESAWELNKAGGKLAETSSITYTDEINNIVLTSDIYGLYRVPTACHQVWLPDQSTHESRDVDFIDVALNKDHDAEYSVTVMLEENDVFCLEIPMFEDTYENKITLGDGVNPGDLEYYQDEISPDMYKGFEVKVSGTYTFSFDYYANHLVITKEVPDTPVDPVDPGDSSGDTPVSPETPENPEEKTDGDSSGSQDEKPASGAVGAPTFQEIFDVIKNTFVDAWNDLVTHIKKWFHIG